MLNALICYHAVYYPWLFCACIFVNQAVAGCVYAGIPVASVKVFGTKHGTNIYGFVSSGVLISSVINVIFSVYLIDVVGIQVLFYIGATLQCASLFILYGFSEELDVENLKKYDGVKLVREEALKSDEFKIEM